MPSEKPIDLDYNTVFWYNIVISKREEKYALFDRFVDWVISAFR